MNAVMADYTQNGRIKIRSTAEPFMRPTYEQWINELKINHTVWHSDPDGKEKSERIMFGSGLKFDNRTFWQKLTGEDY